MDNEIFKVEGRVFTDCNPKNLIIKAEKWDELLSQFDNGEEVEIYIKKKQDNDAETVS